MGEPLVRAVEVSREYGRGDAMVTALAAATFELRAAERVALIGPSGSGKSTLLHLVAGLDRPSAGMIEWPALGPFDRLRPGPIGVAFQGPSLLPPLTVLENVALPLLLMDRSQHEAGAEAAGLIEDLGVAEVTGKLPEELSGGQLQRAGLARAMAGGPRLLVVDEPTGQQDQVSGGRVVDVLLRFAERTGAALLVATHDPAVAGRLSATWTLRNGRLLTEGVGASSR
jgi:ABC-type lipoprotein export system ATPase subunit